MFLPSGFGWFNFCKVERELIIDRFWLFELGTPYSIFSA
jgi:hypothetical protein